MGYGVLLGVSDMATCCALKDVLKPCNWCHRGDDVMVVSLSSTMVTHHGGYLVFRLMVTHHDGYSSIFVIVRCCQQRSMLLLC